MKCSSIDLGTNTCLLLISEWDPKTRQVSRVIEDHATVVRLGQGVDQNRMLAPEAIERTLACLKKYSAVVRAAGLDPSLTVAVATSQARDAKNGTAFFERVREESGFVFRTITGDQEAEFTFLGGLLPGMNPQGSAVVDIGGGSTEFMSYSQKKGHLHGQSLDIGCVRFTERYLRSNPVTDDQFWSCQAAIDQALEPMKAWRAQLASQTQLIAVAGTATTLAAWHLELKKFDASRVDQVELTRGDVHRMVEELKWRTTEERQALPGLEPGRADVLLAGALILWRSMEVLDFKTARVSSRGLRFGVLNLL